MNSGVYVNMVNLVYVRRGFTPEYRGRRIKIHNAALNELKNRISWGLGEVYRGIAWSPIDSFFEASLREIGCIREVSHAKANPTNAEVLIANYRCRPIGLKGDPDFLREIALAHDGVSCLFIDDDKPETMMQDDVVDCFDLVFKREPFLDLDRYELSNANRKKIHPTMLGCPFFHMNRLIGHRMRKDIAEVRDQDIDKEFDVFFRGIATRERELALLGLHNADIGVQGGVHDGLTNSRKVMHGNATKEDKISLVDYARELKRARLSLAIGGHGPFTFRHLEIMALGELMLSEASILDLWLPIALEEGKNLLTYRNQGDLVEKAKFALENDRHARSIAMSGNETFNRMYDTRVHGEAIRQAILSAV